MPDKRTAVIHCADSMKQRASDAGGVNVLCLALEPPVILMSFFPKEFLSHQVIQ